MPKTPAEKLAERMQGKFGEKSVMMASQMPRYPKISTGSLALDFAIGVGGWPSDRYVEVFGAESCGKTTLGLLGMRNFLDAQPKRGAVILDTEHKMDLDWAARITGADYMKTRIIYLQPDSIEDATEMYKECVSDGSTCFVLFDSIASAQTRKSVTTEKDEMTGNAKAMARFAPIMAAFSAKYQCCTFAVNQTRDDIEGFHRIITPGGKAPKHAAVLRVYLKKAKGEVHEDLNGEKVKIGHTVAAKIVKNQAGGIEGRTCQYWFFNVHTDKWGFGVDQVEEISRLAALTGAIERKGAWYYHQLLPDGKICGADQFAVFVKESEPLRAELTTAIMTRLKEHGNEVAPISNSEDLDDMPVGELLRQSVFKED